MHTRLLGRREYRTVEAAMRDFTRGREAPMISAIVVHVMDGTMPGTDSWFRSSASKVSAHYGVSLAGDVVQWVRDEDTAWHAGIVRRPTAEIVRELGGNPNDWSLGIECEGQSDQDPPEAQVRALAELVTLLCDRHGIPLDRKHVIGHREIRADKSCPGKIDVDEVVRLASGGDHPRPGDRRWSEFLGEHVVLTRYESDERWWYVRESLLRHFGAQAATPWSEMPPERR